jgi:hypothetical protein
VFQHGLPELIRKEVLRKFTEIRCALVRKTDTLSVLLWTLHLHPLVKFGGMTNKPDLPMQASTQTNNVCECNTPQKCIRDRVKEVTDEKLAIVSQSYFDKVKRKGRRGAGMSVMKKQRKHARRCLQHSAMKLRVAIVFQGESRETELMKMGVFQNEKNEQEEKSRIRTFKSSFGIYCD